MNVNIIYDELKRFVSEPLKIKREDNDRFMLFIDDQYITTFIPSKQSLDMMKIRITEIQRAYIKGFEDFRSKILEETKKIYKRKLGYIPDFF